MAPRGRIVKSAIPVAAALAAGVLVGSFAEVPVHAKPYDFNGDGRQDLAVGLPRYQPGGSPDAGAVVTLAARSHGLSRAPQLIFRGTPGVPGIPYGDDQFGRALASADFDGDGYADLATTAPGDRALYTVPGARHGIRAAASTRHPLRGARPSFGFKPPTDAILAAADVDQDGFGDLLLGRPDLGRSGDIRLWFGSTTGLSRHGAQVIHRPERRLGSFGSILALGDVNGDGYPDLVTGATGEPLNVDLDSTPGHLVYCRGGPRGPASCRTLRKGQTRPSSLAVSDVTGDHFDDIVVGIPIARTYYEDDPVPPGRVLVLPGTSSGPGAALELTPNASGVPGRSRPDDGFGISVAAADLDSDGFCEIVVGGAGRNGAGRVTVIRGASTGHATNGNVAFDQNTKGVPGSRRPFNGFGTQLTILRGTRGGDSQLVLGVPGRRGGDRGDGSVIVRRSILHSGISRIFTLKTLDLSAPEAPETFGTPAFGAVLGRPHANS
jgi:hypothetical protein